MVECGWPANTAVPVSPAFTAVQTTVIQGHVFFTLAGCHSGAQHIVSDIGATTGETLPSNVEPYPWLGVSSDFSLILDMADDGRPDEVSSIVQEP